jgi:hypothetical protein
MSELKVNKVTPRSGTTVTLGDSGDTITIPSGATITNSGTATGFGGGKVLQVVSTNKTDTFTTTSGTFVDLTGLSLSITPSSTSNKILLSYNVQVGGIIDAYGMIIAVRNSTTIVQNTSASGSRTTGTTAFSMGASGNWQYKLQSATFQVLDSPSTTSATTYKLQIKSAHLNRGLFINRPSEDDNNDYTCYGVSNITAIEIAG